MYDLQMIEATGGDQSHEMREAAGGDSVCDSIVLYSWFVLSQVPESGTWGTHRWYNFKWSKT